MKTPLSDDPGRLSVCRMLPGLLLAGDPIPDPKRPTKKSLAIPNILSTTSADLPNRLLYMIV